MHLSAFHADVRSLLLREDATALRPSVVSILSAALLVLVTVSSALANGYSIGNTSGNLYVQSYARFTRPAFTINSGCQNGQHINQTLWMFSDASGPVAAGGYNAAYDWLEVGFMGGINLASNGTNPPAGCEYAYYYENHPLGNNPGSWERRIPTGVSNSTNDYHVRFVSATIGSQGEYAIIDGTGYMVYYNQTCCSDRIDVGLEASSPGAGWSSQSMHDTPVAYYDRNWIVHNWDGCTVNGFPNNCSYQDAGCTGHWDVVWNDYRNSYP